MYSRCSLLHIKKRKEIWAYLGYIILLYVLALCIWPNINAEEMKTYHYVLAFNDFKFIVSIVFSIFILIVVNNRYSYMRTFSEQVILMLTLFYFLPGIVISGVVDFEWSYILQFFLYFLMMVVFDVLVRSPHSEFKILNDKGTASIRWMFIILSLLYPIFLMKVFGKSLSITEILLTLNDPYGVRNASKEMNISWVIIAIEYWACYFSFIMITYCFKRKKMILGCIYIVCGLFYFTLQGNRIFVFFLTISTILGFFSLNREKIRFVFTGIGIVQIIEYFITSHDKLGMITNIFRRYSIVPNMISTSYFDYFQTAEPDWLRGTFTNLCGFFGITSPYGYEINNTIGSQYYGSKMYANNGMFGGSYFEFGIWGILIDTFMFVLALRLIEKILFKADENTIFIFAIIYASISINQPVMWSGCFKFSYVSLLLITLLLFFNNNDGDVVPTQ